MLEGSSGWVFYTDLDFSGGMWLVLLKSIYVNFKEGSLFEAFYSCEFFMKKVLNIIYL